MEIFKIWAIVGLIFLLVEMATPAMFFLNLAVAAFFAGATAYFVPGNIWAQVWVFVIISLVLLLALRPYLLKRSTPKHEATGIEGKYIGNTAQVIKKIGEEGTDGVGRIKIYGEVWQAKSANDEPIELTSMVRIVRNDSLIMYVEKV